MRDMAKAIADYEKRFRSASGTEGQFYADDIQQIADVSKYGERIEPFYAISNALSAGFMVGYRYAKRQQRKQAKKTC